VFYTDFLLLQFGFVIFWRKNTGAKAVRKMMMKFTTDLNLINILRSAFLYKSVMHYSKFVSVFLAKTNCKKLAAGKMMVKLFFQEFLLIGLEEREHSS